MSVLAVEEGAGLEQTVVSERVRLETPFVQENGGFLECVFDAHERADGGVDVENRRGHGEWLGWVDWVGRWMGGWKAMDDG